MMRRLLLVLALAIGALIAGAGSATAHDVLQSSDPANGSSLTTAPTQLTLTFSASPQDGFTTVTVTGPDGKHYPVGDLSEMDTTVTAPIGPLGPAGEYTVGYRILSSDSHPVAGSIVFTLTAPDPAAAGATGSGTADPEPSVVSTTNTADPGSDDDGTPVWPWFILAGGLLGAGLLFALRVGRAR